MKKSSLFCKIAKCCPNFDYVFREIAKISPKMSISCFAKFRKIAKKKILRNTKLKISRNCEKENFRSHPEGFHLF